MAAGKMPPFLMKKKAPAGKMAGAPMPPMKGGKKPPMPMKKGKAGY